MAVVKHLGMGSSGGTPRWSVSCAFRTAALNNPCGSSRFAQISKISTLQASYPVVGAVSVTSAIAVVERQCSGLTWDSKVSTSSELSSSLALLSVEMTECTNFGCSSDLLYKPAPWQLAVLDGATNHCTLQWTCTMHFVEKLSLCSFTACGRLFTTPS